MDGDRLNSGMKWIWCLLLPALPLLADGLPGKQRELTNVPAIYVPHANNDGDSFRVRVGTNEFIVRLYDVDCAELKRTTKERHAAQVEFFGVDGEALLAVARRAAAYTSNHLSQPFTLRTRWARSYGGERVLAYTFTAEGKDLGGLLVSNRLARAHGGTYNPPKD